MDESISHKYNGAYDYQEGFNQDIAPSQFADIEQRQVIEALQRLDTLVSETRKDLDNE